MRTPTTKRSRALLVSALLVAGAFIAPAAHATVDPTPPPTDTYGPGTTPSLAFDVKQPVCDGDVPYLEYGVHVENPDPASSNDTVTITWVNPSGEDVVQSGLPLDGRVLWPGATVDAAGNPTDWPGWSLVDGEWVVGDEFDWVRQPTVVKFSVNPEAETTVAYPPSSPDCATNPPGTPEPTIKVDVLTPKCIAGVTYLEYGVVTTGTPNQTVTLTWDNPNGPDVVQEGLPLQGRVLWPGAYPERFVDLPASDGWELVNNMWQNTRDYGWAVGTVPLTFTVNPSVTVPVTYPAETENCLEATPVSTTVTTASTTTKGGLAETGATVGKFVGIGAALLLVGGGLVLVAKRGRKSKA